MTNTNMNTHMTFSLNGKKLFLVVLLTIVFWLGMQFVNPVYADTKATLTPNVVLVKFQQGTSTEELSALIAQMSGQIIRRFDALSTVLVQLPENWASARSGVDALSIANQNANVVSVEFDGTVSGFPTEMEQVNGQHTYNSTIPTAPITVNDADYNNPQRQVYAPSMIELPWAWNYTMGSNGIKVAVVDSGVLATHPEFAGRVLPGYDFVNNDTDATDDFGHGTHVAGIIAAGANNEIGMVGVCPNCSIIPVKVLNESNQGTWSAVAAGILFAVDAGANVINLSLGGSTDSQVVADAVHYATVHNVLVVAAAGNVRSNEPFYPAALDEVVGVAATRNDDTIWSLSNYGYFVEVSAPGYAVYSTYNNLGNTYSGYNYMSGTSMAAPHVSGLAGLLFSQNPNLTIAQVRSLLQLTSVDLGDPGRDDHFGYGRIDAFAALQAGYLLLPADAALNGTVWQDDNVNGLWEQEERETTDTDTVSIQLQTSTGTVVAQTKPNSAGAWRIEKLHPGSYQVVAVVSGNTVLTTAGTYNVDLTGGQEIVNLNFGTAQNDPTGISYQVFVPTVQN
jgi:subtilisin family serine protease